MVTTAVQLAGWISIGSGQTLIKIITLLLTMLVEWWNRFSEIAKLLHSVIYTVTVNYRIPLYMGVEGLLMGNLAHGPR